MAMSVSVGDKVLLSESYNGTEVQYEGKEYVLYSESLIHPPFLVMNVQNNDESMTKVQ